MSWLHEEGKKGNWLKAGRNENPLGVGWYDGKSRPLGTLVKQKQVTPKTFFTKIGKSFLSLR
ncbi:hypothetical protein [Hazenella coriacea]|uniref:Uncharacterized protein n=1 Tax=Hazenella coriacea TaxID=1179467 RepID=A0A4R3L3H8_9BACL|nr:hypothetical protein [Hazenella coriacea]TCS92213.1 hypothetical protein EDD58_1144 [Hazenella coriacea]